MVCNMKIYLDVCCLNRPFDEMNQDRIRLEAEAIISILSHCRTGKWSLVNSTAINFEVSKNVDQDKIQRISNMIGLAKEHIKLDESIAKRTRELEDLGFKRFDAFHIAFAEKAQVDVLLTTDDKFEKRASRENIEIQVRVVNPLKWLLEREGK